MKKYLYIFIVSIFLSISSFSAAQAQNITLSWDPSPSSAVTGYKIYYKQNDSGYPFNGVGAAEGSSPIDVKNTLSATITGLDDNSTYYFAVTAYDSLGNESSYSNVVSTAAGNSPSAQITIVRPADGSVNEPVPVTFQWSFDQPGTTLAYTLYYGTNQNSVTSAGSINSYPRNPQSPEATVLLLVIIASMCSSFIVLPGKKWRFATVTFSLVLALSACGGSSNSGGDSSTSRSSTTVTNPPSTQDVYSIYKGNSDYHQAFDLLPGTKYYWKVIGVDTADPTKTYASPVVSFTTENF